MTAAERTYTFRAPRAFGERLMRARQDFLVITGDAALSADFGREFRLTLLRRLEQLDADAPDGVLIRTLSDAFASAADRVRSERAWMAELVAIDQT